MSTLFHELFVGNPTAVGTESGGAKRMSIEMMDQMSPDMWFQQQLNAHLLIGGQYAIGVYPVDNGMVRWGCVDWDEGEGDLVHAENTRVVLETFGVASWIERSRSKGFHLWVFMDDWMPMADMRKALLVACEIADAPTKEINPKQMELRDGALGNYVRAPYPGGGSTRAIHEARRTGLAGGPTRGGGEFPHPPPSEQEPKWDGSATDDRQGHCGASEGNSGSGRRGSRDGQGQALPRQELEEHVCVASSGAGGSERPDDGALPANGRETQASDQGGYLCEPRLPRHIYTSEGPLTLEEFSNAAFSQRNAPILLEPLVDMWVEPPPTFAPLFVPDNAGEIHKRMSGFAATVFRDGPRDGADRSETLWKLARAIANHGRHTEAEALELVTEADARWGGKFTNRADGPEQLQKLVAKAFL